MTSPDLEEALRLATRLRDAVAAELEHARNERQRLRALDARGLLDRAAQRASFLAEAAQLEGALAARLPRVGERLGIVPLTVERLRARPHADGGALGDTLAELRRHAASLHEVDRINLELARRAMTVVRGYLDALRPAPRAYDRHGGRPTSPSAALVSTQG